MPKPITPSAAAAALGRIGGQSTSPRKRAASAANGSKGGRAPKGYKIKRSTNDYCCFAANYASVSGWECIGRAPDYAEALIVCRKHKAINA